MASPQTLSLFSNALNEIADGPRVTSHVALTEALMRRMAEKGATLDELCGPKVMKRSRLTLERYAKQFQIAFPDFTPPNMRKQAAFHKSGDSYICTGRLAGDVQDVIGSNSIPKDGYAEAKRKLRAAGIEARVLQGRRAA